MAAILWNQYPGEWLVRVLESNAPALLFWRTAISLYTQDSCQEEWRIVNGRSWRFFKFESRIV
jgi:predicted acetyltransferase